MIEKQDWQWLIAIVIKAKALKSEAPKTKPIRERRVGGRKPSTTCIISQEVKNMKTYDVLFAISAIAGLYFIGLDRYGIECLISGLVIGGYIGWRVSK